MKQEIIEILKSKFPFIYEKELIEEISNEGILKCIPKGTHIMEPGQLIRSMPLVIDGKIKIVREDSGEGELFLYYLGEGDTCAVTLMCCMQYEKSKIRAIAEENTTLLLVDIKYVGDWMCHQSWKKYVMDSYSYRFEELLNLVDNIAFKSVDEKLLSYLKKHCDNKSKIIQTTHKAIADELNTSREVISRLLKKLENKGLVKLSRNKIELISLLS